jgi:hypothetical protein
MKITGLVFAGFLLLLIAGLTTCVPGICGCAFSWLPDQWEGYADLPALIADAVGLIGCVVSGLLFLVLWTRRQTMKTGQAARAAQHDGQATTSV